MSWFVGTIVDKGSEVGTTGRSDEFGDSTCLVFEVKEVGRGSGAAVDSFKFGPDSFGCPDGGSDERFFITRKEGNGFQGCVFVNK